MEASESLIKGFFVGFIAAQFISGWISGPIILVVLFLYVFLGGATRKIGKAIIAKAPGFMVNYFVGLPVQQEVPNAFEDPFTVTTIDSTHNSNMFPSPFYSNTARQ